jgi:hypothetical protein
MVTTEKNRKKKEKPMFKLETNWILSEPIDFEHKQYLLYDFLQYADKKIEKFEIYPIYTEISLHLANLQSISNEFKSLYFTKVFQNIDDEILISELKYKPLEIKSEKEFDEFNEIVKFAGQKILNYFNIVKSVYTIIYDSISVQITKNEKNFNLNSGFIHMKKGKENHLWIYDIEKRDRLTIDTKMNLTKLDIPENLDDINTLIELHDGRKKLPVFLITATYDFPFEASLIPASKRKVLSYLIQRKTIENLKKQNNE